MSLNPIATLFTSGTNPAFHQYINQLIHFCCYCREVCIRRQLCQRLRRAGKPLAGITFFSLISLVSFWTRLGSLRRSGFQGIHTGSETYEQDRQAAAEVAQCLRDNGWELASHSWGHLDLGTVEWDRFQSDTDKWESEIESLIGPTDIILFPFGADVGDWHPYTMENERFRYLYNAGFRYFCNVDSSQYWVQLGDDYLRQGRRNLDGYRMWKDITAEAEGRPRKLDDLFRAEDIFDKSRPTPVPEM